MPFRRGCRSASCWRFSRVHTRLQPLLLRPPTRAFQDKRPESSAGKRFRTGTCVPSAWRGCCRKNSPCVTAGGFGSQRFLTTGTSTSVSGMRRTDAPPSVPVRYGCGNSVHISCMKVWADHQGLSDGREMLRCPLCRECFSSLQLLQEQAKNAARLFTAAERERAERHLGVVCCSCRVGPVTGTCYRWVGPERRSCSQAAHLRRDSSNLLSTGWGSKHHLAAMVVFVTVQKPTGTRG